MSITIGALVNAIGGMVVAISSLVVYSIIGEGSIVAWANMAMLLGSKGTSTTSSKLSITCVVVALVAAPQRTTSRT